MGAFGTQIAVWPGNPMPVFDVEVIETRRRVHRIVARDGAAAEAAALFGRAAATTQQNVVTEDETTTEQIRNITEVGR